MSLQTKEVLVTNVAPKLTLSDAVVRKYKKKITIDDGDLGIKLNWHKVTTFILSKVYINVHKYLQLLIIINPKEQRMLVIQNSTSSYCRL